MEFLGINKGVNNILYGCPMPRRRKKVSFKATRRIPKTVNVKFYTSKGRKVSFKSVKRTPKTVKVTFYAKKRRRR